MDEDAEAAGNNLIDWLYVNMVDKQVNKRYRYMTVPSEDQNDSSHSRHRVPGPVSISDSHTTPKVIESDVLVKSGFLGPVARTQFVSVNACVALPGTAVCGPVDLSCW